MVKRRNAVAPSTAGSGKKEQYEQPRSLSSSDLLISQRLCWKNVRSLRVRRAESILLNRVSQMVSGNETHSLFLFDRASDCLREERTPSKFIEKHRWPDRDSSFELICRRWTQWIDFGTFGSPVNIIRLSVSQTSYLQRRLRCLFTWTPASADSTRVDVRRSQLSQEKRIEWNEENNTGISWRVKNDWLITAANITSISTSVIQGRHVMFHLASFSCARFHLLVIIFSSYWLDFRAHGSLFNRESYWPYQYWCQQGMASRTINAWLQCWTTEVELFEMCENTSTARPSSMGLFRLLLSVCDASELVRRYRCHGRWIEYITLG